MTDFINKYILIPDFITQLFATIIGIVASIITTIITLRVQGKRELQARKQVQHANVQTAIELFRAYIACLIPFHKFEYSADECNNLLIQCQKMENIEQALAKLNTNDFPRNFLNDFVSYQVRIMNLRISIMPSVIQACNSQTSQHIDTADMQKMLDELYKFIDDHDIKPED